MKWCTWVLFVAVSSCGDAAADPRVAQLEQQLSEIRRQAAREAISPLADAIQLLQRQQQLEEKRTAALAAEFHQLGSWLHTVVPDAQREAVRALEQRMTTLEQEFAQRQQQHAAETALLMQAIDGTVTRLEQLLQKLTGPAPATGVPPPADPDKQDAGSAWLLWLLVLPLLWVWWMARRLPADPAAAVTQASRAPQPGSMARAAEPRAARFSLKATHPDALVGPLAHRLAREPLVLIEPTPLVRAQGDDLLVDFQVAGYAAPGTESRIEAELRGLALELARRSHGTAA